MLGLLFLVLAAGRWRERPRPGEAPELPGWMAAIDRMSFGKGIASITA